MATTGVLVFRGVRGCPPHRAKRAVVHIQGSAYTTRGIYKAVLTAGAAHKRRFVATTRALVIRGGAGLSPASGEASHSPHTRQHIHKAGHLQGGAHTRRCTRKAVRGHRKSLVILGGCGGGLPHQAKRAIVHIQGSAYTRRSTYKAVLTQGAAHERRSVATAKVLLFRGVAGVSPASSEASHSPHTRERIHKAGHL